MSAALIGSGYVRLPYFQCVASLYLSPSAAVAIARLLKTERIKYKSYTIWGMIVLHTSSNIFNFDREVRSSLFQEFLFFLRPL